MNKVIIVGHLLKEPTITDAKNSFTITMTLATSFNAVTEFHSIIAWRKNADKYREFTKGDNILVEGALSSYSYVDKEGNKRWRTNIKADRIQKISGSSHGESSQEESSPVDMSGF